MKQSLAIYSLILFLLFSCGQPGNKTGTENQQIIMAEKTKISELRNTLTSLKNGELEYDFFGLTSNGTDCLYFVFENNNFNIEFEVMTESQKPYFEKIKMFCKENKIKTIETTYQNKPQYNDKKFAPVLRLETNSALEQTARLGQRLMSEIFNNDSNTIYEIVP